MNKKNIRQIGQIKGSRRIYIEDYAMTYMKQLAEMNASYARMAVLVGEMEKEEGEECFYIYGVLDVPSKEQGVGYQMDSAAWTHVYALMRQHFPEREILGWYLTGEELEVEKSEWLHHFHRDNFAGDDKFLFYNDIANLEEAAYFCEEGQWKKQSGYYIFYEKNEEMQNLLIARNQSERGTLRGGNPEEQGELRGRIRNVREEEIDHREWDEQGEQEPPERVVREMRRALGEKQNRKMLDEAAKKAVRSEKSEGRRGTLGSYLAGAVSAVAVLALCLVVFQYFDRLSGLEKTVQQLTGALSEVMNTEEGSVLQNTDDIRDETEEGSDTEDSERKSGGVMEIETLPGGVEEAADTEEEKDETDSKEDMKSVEEGAAWQNGAENSEENELEPKEPEAKTDAPVEEGAEADAKTVETNKDTAEVEDPVVRTWSSYVVQAGDTLSGICQVHYQNLNMMDRVMEVNGLTNPDGILEGDVLILPES